MPSVRMADIVNVEELKMQLQHVRGRRFRKSELVWLAGNTFYGTRGIFEPAFLEWLETRLSALGLSAASARRADPSDV